MLSDPKIEQGETVWRVFVNSDLTEGKGHSVCIATCKFEATARRIAKGKNVQGTDGTVRPLQVLRVDGLAWGPISITQPTASDVEDQNTLDVQARNERFRARKMQLAIDQGLSISDLEAITGMKHYEIQSLLKKQTGDSDAN